jgi:hypothetical protein
MTVEMETVVSASKQEADMELPWSLQVTQDRKVQAVGVKEYCWKRRDCTATYGYCQGWQYA